MSFYKRSTVSLSEFVKISKENENNHSRMDCGCLLNCKRLMIMNAAMILKTGRNEVLERARLHKMYL